MPTWSSRKAQERFEALLKAATDDGPQVITRCGEEIAVLVPIEEWQRLKPVKKNVNIKELLLAGPKFDLKLPKRRRWKLRPPIDFSGPDFR